ncbi:MAG: pyridoxal-phosphate dependent enzyme [Proteobacteria bacterium]|nr:pyridoxal-phosphate dependent enzyme [Pseudomonadota bacterium]
MTILDLIGNTPIVKLQGLDTGPCELFAKLEFQNPGGSIKDRIALSMIDDAEKRGLIKPGDTLVEATAGNTGLGLAMVAPRRGYKLVLFIPDKMSREKISHLRALGAQIILTRSDVAKGNPEYYQDRAAEYAKTYPNCWYVNQFANPANPDAHEHGTAPEIWEQMQHNVDAVVCGVGSGGTIAGLSRYFAKVAPHLDLVLADPQGSILTHYIKTGEVSTEVGSWVVEGIGEDFVPEIADLSRVKHAYTITDKESLLAARELLATNGLLGGSSSGTLLAAALKYCREQKVAKRVVTFVCDSGNKYLSKQFNDQWMVDQGFISRKQYGDLRDLISRRHDEGSTITLSPNENLLTAYQRMKANDISQLPVLEGSKVVGLLDELDVLTAVQKDRKNFSRAVRELMTTNLELLKPSDSREKILSLFERGMVALVADDSGFYGLITRMDFLNYLRRAV